MSESSTRLTFNLYSMKGWCQFYLISNQAGAQECRDEDFGATKIDSLEFSKYTWSI